MTCARSRTFPFKCASGSVEVTALEKDYWTTDSVKRLCWTEVKAEADVDIFQNIFKIKYKLHGNLDTPVKSQRAALKREKMCMRLASRPSATPALADVDRTKDSPTYTIEIRAKDGMDLYFVINLRRI